MLNIIIVDLTYKSVKKRKVNHIPEIGSCIEDSAFVHTVINYPNESLLTDLNVNRKLDEGIDAIIYKSYSAPVK